MLRLGHRGAKAYEPENMHALEIGVAAVELDVRKTKDNQLVVIHDADVKKPTDGKGLVNELTLNEIKFSAGKGEKVPTLEKALVLDKKAKILIELKEMGIEEKVLSIVHGKGCRNTSSQFPSSKMLYERLENWTLRWRQA